MINMVATSKKILLALTLSIATVLVVMHMYGVDRLFRKSYIPFNDVPTKRTFKMSTDSTNSNSMKTNVTEAQKTEEKATNQTTTKHRNTPKTHFLFLKTHKTGSSTVQNVLERYAVKNNILVGMPRSTHMFNYGAPFRRTSMLQAPPGRTISMLMHHMVFNYNEVSAVLPPDSVYFTILRDPATQFESAFRYMRQDVPPFQRAELSEWISNPEKYFKGRGDGMYWWFAKNNMFFDLGFDNLNNDDVYINESIAKMDDIFHFVLIAEYFDMSMLLLKDLLCWTMDDILSLSVNARKNPKVLDVDIQEKIRAWNKADTAIYRHYNASFWKRVDVYGKERMEKDLVEYQARKEKLKAFCVVNETFTNADIKDNQFKVFNPRGVQIEQYKLREEAKNNQTCIGLVLPELRWDSKLRDHFYRKH